MNNNIYVTFRNNLFLLQAEKINNYIKNIKIYSIFKKMSIYILLKIPDKFIIN